VRECGVVVFVMMERKSWSIAPIEEVSGDVAAGVAVEGDVGAFGKALVQAERDGCLLGAGLAELVGGVESAPIITGCRTFVSLVV